MTSTRLRIARYEIGHQENGPCTFCDWEQDEGEQAFELRDTYDNEMVETGFCSEACARRWARRRDYQAVT